MDETAVREYVEDHLTTFQVNTTLTASNKVMLKLIRSNPDVGIHVTNLATNSICHGPLYNISTRIASDTLVATSFRFAADLNPAATRRFLQFLVSHPVTEGFFFIKDVDFIMEHGLVISPINTMPWPQFFMAAQIFRSMFQVQSSFIYAWDALSQLEGVEPLEAWMLLAWTKTGVDGDRFLRPQSVWNFVNGHLPFQDGARVVDLMHNVRHNIFVFPDDGATLHEKMVASNYAFASTGDISRIYSTRHDGLKNFGEGDTLFIPQVPLPTPEAFLLSRAEAAAVLAEVVDMPEPGGKNKSVLPWPAISMGALVQDKPKSGGSSRGKTSTASLNWEVLINESLY
jgi:hypothetical protein